MVLDVVEQGNAQKEQFSELLAALREIPQIGGKIRAVVQPVQPDVNVVRAEKIQRLTQGLQKLAKIRLWGLKLNPG